MPGPMLSFIHNNCMASAGPSEAPQECRVGQHFNIITILQ